MTVSEVVRAFLIAGLAGWTICALGVLWARHRVRRHLRIDPKVRSHAPTVWVISPFVGARLHRRLRTVGVSAQAVARTDLSLRPICAELTGEALALESRVVAMARSRRTGSLARRRLAEEIAELEAAARRLSTLAAPAADAGGVTRLHERVAALEAAHQELAEIDRRAGLLRHA